MKTITVCGRCDSVDWKRPVSVEVYAVDKDGETDYYTPAAPCEP